MPEPVSRSVGSGFASPAYPIVANNPAFKVEILPLDNRLEQNNNSKPNDKEMGEIKVGDIISGEKIGGTKEATERVEGRVIAIDQEDETVLAIKVLTDDGEEAKIDPTTASRVDVYPEDFSKQPGTPYEGRLLNYEQWLTESQE